MARKIGIVGGTGAEGSGLAYRWGRAGETVLIGSRDVHRAQDTAERLASRIGPSANISGTDNANVLNQCEVVVLTVPFSGQSVLLKQLKPLWKPDTIVIDTSVPLATSIGGAATQVLGVWQGSAAQQTRQLLPDSVGLAAAFQNLSADMLISDEAVDCDVLICSDDERARHVASELAAKIPGARPLNGGKLENARIIEGLTALLIGLNVRYRVHGAGVRFTGLLSK